MSRRPISPGDGRRKRRARKTPKWLKEHREMDEMARRRALLILSVLSGETTVTDAIETAGISRGTYYKLEQKALMAMVKALIPGAEDGQEGQALTEHRLIEELQAKVQRLEQEKRRREKLTSLTDKILGAGPVKTNRGGGRPRKKKDSTRTRGGVAGA